MSSNISCCFSLSLLSVASTVPKEERMVMAIGEIIAELVKAVQNKQDVNLNK